jgi:hypothetical protein
MKLFGHFSLLGMIISSPGKSTTLFKGGMPESVVTLPASNCSVRLHQ